MKSIIVVVAFSLMPLCGCGSYSNWLRSRAAFDLDCSQENLTLETLGPWSVTGVRGCGKKAVYVFIGDQWLLNSDGQHEVLQAAIIEEQRRLEEKRKKEEEEKREWEEFRKRRKESMEDTP